MRLVIELECGCNKPQPPPPPPPAPPVPPAQ